MSHRDERLVILCLLELARIGQKFGLETPTIIKMEGEIDRADSDKDSGISKSMSANSKTSSLLKKSKSMDAIDHEVLLIINDKEIF